MENETKLQYVADTVREAQMLNDREEKGERIPKFIRRAMRKKLNQSHKYLVQINVSDRAQKKKIIVLMEEVEILKKENP